LTWKIDGHAVEKSLSGRFGRVSVLYFYSFKISLWLYIQIFLPRPQGPIFSICKPRKIIREDREYTINIARRLFLSTQYADT
jgi:hypothetical protein